MPSKTQTPLSRPRIGIWPAGRVRTGPFISRPGRDCWRSAARWPVYDAGDAYEADLLAGAYQSSLRLAVEQGLRGVAFPSLSTGAFCYPVPLAAPVALTAILDFLQEPNALELVRLVLYPREDPAAYAVYAGALKTLLAQRRAAAAGPHVGSGGF